MIVVDTSALIAVAADEPEAAACEALLTANDLVISAATLAETLIVAKRKNVEDSLQALQAPRSGGAPVTVRRWSDAERVQWARNLPRLATDWVGLQRSPAAARNIARAYMNGLRRRGAKPLRDWDREL